MLGEIFSLASLVGGVCWITQGCLAHASKQLPLSLETIWRKTDSYLMMTHMNR